MARRPRDVSWPDDAEALPHPVVDNHTHLDAVLDATGPDGWAAGRAGAADDAADRTMSVEDHLTRAASVGVTRLVQVGCDLPSLDWTVDAVGTHPALLGALAIHPNEAVLHAGVREVAPDGLEPAPAAHHAVALDDALARVADLARSNPRIRAIGETGLDHFRAGPQGRAVQRAAFREHIALAKDLGLALQIHDRDAHEEVLAVLAQDGAPERTVFHCFSGDAAMARYCAERGWFLSFAGPVTFGGSAGLRAALREVPLGQVLLETDAPYLTAHPYRGRPNAPYLLAVTARFVATTLEVPTADLCAAVWTTSEQVYGPW